MSHDHAGHSHAAPATEGRLALAVLVNVGLTVVQVVGGILSGSLALVADALHNFSDAASLGIAWGARRIARRPADASMTFGLDSTGCFWFSEMYISWPRSSSSISPP